MERERDFIGFCSPWELLIQQAETLCYNNLTEKKESFSPRTYLYTPVSYLEHIPDE